MSWLLIIGLKNAIFVMPLALLAFGIGRYSKRPALAHVLWLVVLVKLLTPPLVDVPIVPVGWLDVDSLISPAEPVPAPVAPAMQLATVRQTGVLDTACEPAPAATVRSEVGPQPVAVTCPTDNPAAAASLPPVATQLAMTWLRSPALWVGLAGAVWMIGSLIVAVLLATRAWRFHRFVRLAARVDDRLAGRVAELAANRGPGPWPSRRRR